MLGVKLIDGRGRMLRFGGEVMKNVAGYDASRLRWGAVGTLGLLLEISIKVLPCPDKEITLDQVAEAQEAIEAMNHLAARPVPLSVACFDGLSLHYRLSGASSVGFFPMRPKRSSAVACRFAAAAPPDFAGAIGPTASILCRWNWCARIGV